MKKLKYKLKKFLKNFFLIDDTPHKIAAGAALGIFLGIFPGMGIIAAVFFSSVFRFNRLAALSATLAVNTWITVVTLPLAAAVGGFIFNTNPQMLISDFQNNYQLGWKTFFQETVFLELLFPLLVGFILIAATISISFYFLLFYLLKNKKIRFK